MRGDRGVDEKALASQADAVLEEVADGEVIKVGLRREGRLTESNNLNVQTNFCEVVNKRLQIIRHSYLELKGSHMDCCVKSAASMFGRTAGLRLQTERKGQPP